MIFNTIVSLVVNTLPASKIINIVTTGTPIGILTRGSYFMCSCNATIVVACCHSRELLRTRVTADLNESKLCNRI